MVYTIEQIEEKYPVLLQREVNPHLTKPITYTIWVISTKNYPSLRGQKWTNTGWSNLHTLEEVVDIIQKYIVDIFPSENNPKKYEKFFDI